MQAHSTYHGASEAMYYIYSLVASPKISAHDENGIVCICLDALLARSDNVEVDWFTLCQYLYLEGRYGISKYPAVSDGRCMDIYL
jgi:hypothetical protein